MKMEELNSEVKPKPQKFCFTKRSCIVIFTIIGILIGIGIGVGITTILLTSNSRMSNIESNNSQNGGLEDYINISDGIFPHFTTPSIKITLG